MTIRTVVPASGPRTRRRTPIRRRALCLALVATAAAVAGSADAAGAQSAGAAAARVDDSPADTVAAEFLRGFQSMAWEGLTQRLHPEALDYLRLAIVIQIDADSSGWALSNLGGSDSRAAFDALSDAEVFVGVMRWTQSNALGLINSFVSRDAELVGIVPEGADTAHAVYRVTTHAYGAEPTVQVATLARTPAGWKVIEAPEIRALHTALRRLPVPRGGPLPP
ncbi:hypothetical protein [Gaopeijia maritima]|uniref:Uncharacterized protein n=1 Tax=Gaopeijia maritima TaxID=3119007 RepID=A0ABU9EF86_9BACT